jgi:hypothetical protein
VPAVLTGSVTNGAYNAAQYGTTNGIANAITAGCSGAGCQVVANPTYGLTEFPSYFTGNLNSTYTGVGTTNPANTEIFDYRSGRYGHIFNDPTLQVGDDFVGEYTTDIRTKQQSSTPAVGGAFTSRTILQENLGNGSNDAILGKTTTTALGVFQYNYQQGQHITQQVVNYTHGIGDTLAETLRSQSNGGYRNAYDEGTHLFDTYAVQDNYIYQGTCLTGCTTGSQALTLTATFGANTQGDGRILYDTAAGDTTSFTVQTITDSGGGNLMVAGNNSSQFTKITPVSQTFTASQITTLTAAVSASSFNPATTYTFPVANSAGFSTGLACLADENSGAYSNFEWVNIASITDGTHIVATMKYSHPTSSVLTQGGMCGKVFVMQADTYTASVPKPLRRVFPIMGSLDGSTLWVFSGASLQSAMASSFINTTLAGISSLVRTSNVVTLTIYANSPLAYDPTGLNVTVSGASDSTFNGTFSITGASTYGPGRWTKISWSQTGANSSASGASASVQSLNATANTYYGAEVYNVQGANNDTTDNHFALSPNILPFTAGLTLEEAEWMQQRVSENFNFQTAYFPDVITNDPVLGYGVSGLMNSNRVGFKINNGTPVNLYTGHGGSYTPPNAFLYNQGLWNNWMSGDYAPETSVIKLPCKLGGCSGTDAAIGIVTTPNNGANFQYDPNNYTWAWWIPGGTTPVLSICCGASNAGSSTVTAYYPFVANAGIQTSFVNVNGSQALNGVQGNGTKFAAASGGFTPYNITLTDANGNLVDGTINYLHICQTSGTNCPTIISGLTSGYASFGATPTSISTPTQGIDYGISAANTLTAHSPMVIPNLTVTSCTGCGSGGGISGLTTGYIPKASSPTAIANSLLDDGITTANTLTYAGTGGISANYFTSTDTTHNSNYTGKQAAGGVDVLPTQATGSSYITYLAATGWNEADGTGAFSPLTRAVDFAAGPGLSVSVSGKTVTYSPTASVKSFGAIGDGAHPTQDNAGLRAGINSVCTSGGSLYIPAGTYNFDNSAGAFAVSGCAGRIYGDGPSSVIVFSTLANDGWDINTPTSFGLENLHLTFAGTTTTRQPSVGYPVNINGGSNIVLRNLLLNNGNISAMRVGNAQHVRIEGTTLSGFLANGVYTVNNNDIQIRDTSCTGGGDACVEVDWIDSAVQNAQPAIVDGVNSYNDVSCVLIDGTSQVTVSNFNCVKNAHQGIYIEQDSTTGNNTHYPDQIVIGNGNIVDAGYGTNSANLATATGLTVYIQNTPASKQRITLHNVNMTHIGGNAVTIADNNTVDLKMDNVLVDAAGGGGATGTNGRNQACFNLDGDRVEMNTVTAANCAGPSLYSNLTNTILGTGFTSINPNSTANTTQAVYYASGNNYNTLLMNGLTLIDTQGTNRSGITNAAANGAQFIPAFTTSFTAAWPGVTNSNGVASIYPASTHLAGRGAAPTSSVNAPVAGTGATSTVAAGGHDSAFTLNITTGTGPTSGVLTQVNFNVPFVSTRHCGAISGNNAASTAQLANLTFNGGSVGQMNVNAITAPAASTAYSFEVVCVQ